MWQKIRLSTDSSKASETSNLKFNHKVHLNPEGIDSPGDTKRLTCSSCHQPGGGGIGMLPIDMKEHCSECHSLQYGNVSLPHASVEQVLYILRGYYQNPPVVQAKVQPDVMYVRRQSARRPGEEGMEDTSSRTPMQSALRAARDIFDRTLCKVCHEIKQNPQQVPGWEVTPVKINQEWMPLAYFSHKSHLESKCVDCHGAKTSKRSEDILLPRIKTCRECHADSGDASSITSTCIVCHRFHIPGNKTLTPKRERPIGASNAT